jgi:uncharacterized caspase-like protein
MLIVSNPICSARDSVVFSSSASRQISNWYPEKKHGLFTYYFLCGLQGKADANGDGQVTVQEMEEYLSRNVPQQARALYNRDQTPTVEGNKNKVVVLLK